MPGACLQERQSAVSEATRRLESGQDTTEYVLIVILFALSFSAGMMVWARSVQGSYRGVGDCIAANDERRPADRCRFVR